MNHLQETLAEFDKYGMHQTDGLPVVGWPEIKADIRTFITSRYKDLEARIDQLWIHKFPKGVIDLGLAEEMLSKEDVLSIIRDNH